MSTLALTYSSKTDLVSYRDMYKDKATKLVHVSY